MINGWGDHLVQVEIGVQIYTTLPRHKMVYEQNVQGPLFETFQFDSLNHHFQQHPLRQQVPNLLVPCNTQLQRLKSTDME